MFDTPACRSENRDLPRALLPLKQDKGLISLSAFRSPLDATNPQSRATSAPGEPVLVWVDVHVPPKRGPASTLQRATSSKQSARNRWRLSK
jgi:hypothetical protein